MSMGGLSSGYAAPELFTGGFSLYSDQYTKILFLSDVVRSRAFLCATNNPAADRSEIIRDTRRTPRAPQAGAGGPAGSR